MAQSGLSLWQTFNNVGLQVKDDTGGVQKPWISNEPIKGEFCFAGCAGMAESADAAKLRLAEQRIRELETAAEGRNKPVLSAAERPACGRFRQHNECQHTLL